MFFSRCIRIIAEDLELVLGIAKPLLHIQGLLNLPFLLLLSLYQLYGRRKEDVTPSQDDRSPQDEFDRL